MDKLKSSATDLIFGYQETKMKAHLKMASQRLGMLMNKRRNAVKVQQREVAQLLAQKKEESARIKVEHVRHVSLRSSYNAMTYPTYSFRSYVRITPSSAMN